MNGSPSYLDTLNEPQREAVLHNLGPAMIIAGAGSGKTRVLTYRIAHLMANGVDPYNILSLTFTNKASKEMRERIEDVVGSDARSLWMGTFHSVFARILRSEADKLGYPSNFTIYDTDDAKSLIKSIVKEQGLDEKLYKPNMVLNRISSAKNRLVSWYEYNQQPIYKADDEAAGRPEIGRLYKIYQERCFRAGAMDFDDLLFNTSLLLKSHPDVLLKYQHRFKYVMVDEFQDTNLAQYYITKKLAAVHRNIVVVGDDAQSIYAFRGADIQNILNFEKDYDELKVFKLEHNYRSTETIVEAANSIIKKNTAQLPKKVFTTNQLGDKIKVITAMTDNEEGKIIANQIYERKNEKQLIYKDFAILYRTNSQSRALEESLRKINVPYRIFGGMSFYQRKEIKDLLAYLKYTVNPNDEQALKRIINYPKRGIGPTTVAKIMVFGNENNVSTWESLQASSRYLPKRTANTINSFVNLIKNFQISIAANDAYNASNQIAKETGILKDLYSDKSIEGLARHENVQELLNAIKEFVEDKSKESKTLPSFLEEVSLLTNADASDKQEDYVSLMSIHASKGLEFKDVVVAGLEEDLFPSQMMLSSRADLEEERRLFYVAITRAETNLTLTNAHTRYRFGRLKNCETSRFIKEIDVGFLDIKIPRRKEKELGETPSVQSGAYSQSYGSLLKNFKSVQENRKSGPTHKVSADFKPSDPKELQEGLKVEHPKFGFGTIKQLDLTSASKKAIVNFDKFGEKTLLLSFAKLKIHH
jgi:DNA helicase-2/ATP-dependent DNA helicase PcrA